MTAVLLKRDLLLLKRYWGFLLAFTILIPVFMLSRMERVEEFGAMGLLMEALVVEIVLYTNVCAEEEKYPGAEILLCCAPVSRKSGVIARYLFLFLLSLLVAFFYQTAAMVMDKGILSLRQIIQALAVVTLVMDVFIPVVYIMGIGKLQYIIMFIVMGGSFGGPLLTKTSFYQNAAAYLEQHPLTAAVGFGLLCVAANVISCCVSMRIYSRKELRG